MPGSSESGAVPNTSVMVPPDLLLELDELVELEELFELEELPHAASANAARTASATHSGLLYFLMRPPPRGLSRGNLID